MSEAFTPGMDSFETFLRSKGYKNFVYTSFAEKVQVSLDELLSPGRSKLHRKRFPLPLPAYHLEGLEGIVEADGIRFSGADSPTYLPLITLSDGRSSALLDAIYNYAQQRIDVVVLIYETSETQDEYARITMPLEKYVKLAGGIRKL